MHSDLTYRLLGLPSLIGTYRSGAFEWVIHVNHEIADLLTCARERESFVYPLRLLELIRVGC